MNRNAASRKFIKLLHNATNKCANWNPEIPAVRVGAYGRINRETGDFECAGSIYENEDVRKIIKISDWLPQVSDASGKTHVCVESKNSRRIDFDRSTRTNAFGLAEVYAGGRWAFQRGRGAVLIMYEPRQSHLPRNVPIEALVKSRVLDGYSLVTHVYHCPAYASYLSNEGGDSLSVGLGVKAPNPNAPVISVQGGMSPRWWTSAGAGIYRDGFNETGRPTFTPLYSLKKMKISWGRLRARAAQSSQGIDLLEDEDLPWNEVDENGVGTKRRAF